MRCVLCVAVLAIALFAAADAGASHGDLSLGPRLDAGGPQGGATREAPAFPTRRSIRAARRYVRRRAVSSFAARRAPQS